MATRVRDVLACELDDDGLLKYPAQWNETVAQEIAHQLGIGVLTEQHWEVVLSLREYHARYDEAPAMIQVCRQHGRDRHGVHDLCSRAASTPGALPACRTWATRP